MTKSNIRAVRRRKTNQRIARQFDQVQQDEVRAYQERNIQRREAAVDRSRVSVFRRVFYRVRSAFTRFLRRMRPRYSSMRGLDLRGGGLYSNKPKRDAGAQMLRSWFGSGLKMVSTRDGKRV